MGAPKGSVSSLATGLVYECPITPGKCELMTNNTGDLKDSMLQGVVCVSVYTSVLVCAWEGGWDFALIACIAGLEWSTYDMAKAL